jgi:preprotein translocase subunit SecY
MYNNKMIGNFLKKLKLIGKDKSLSYKILFVLVALVVFRLLSAIPIPGIDQNALADLFSGNSMLGLINISSGGGLSGFSIAMLGAGPYITASIIMQVLTMVFPKLKSLSTDEGEAGKKKFMQYSRALTVPLAVIQGFSFIILLQSRNVISDMTSSDMIGNIVVITAGAMLIMWLGELMTEFGVGNGISLIIFAGIVAGLPGTLQNLYLTYNPADLPALIAFVIVGIIIVIGVVLINEAERPVPITYAKQARGGANGGIATYLPLRINQAGVIPIIFALSILMIPNILSNVLGALSNPIAQRVSVVMASFIGSPLNYGISYFLLVFLLTYFYTAVTFDPDSIASNLQKSGAFVPGVRPGKQTSKYLGDVVSRITLVGAIFLGSIAVLPIIVQELSGITTITIGGTALLIAVSVAIDFVKKIDSQVSMKEY